MEARELQMTFGSPVTAPQEEAGAPTGVTFNVQRFSTEDGPGIRTTVFMKGCPLRCDWCHNPEGLSSKPELVWYDVRCIGARRCLDACPAGALELSATGMQVDRERCSPCDLCADACPSGALEVIGRRWTVGDLLAHIAKDSVFYETSGGGVTVSGGEPTMQPDFVDELLLLCKEAGIATALDTCGYAAWSVYERILPNVDLVLYDLKIMDPERHRQATGVDPERILANAVAIAGRGAPMWVRTPIVPGYSDDEENIAALAGFIRERLPTVERWDFLAYTKLGRPKYGRLGLAYRMEEAEPPDRGKMERLTALASEAVGRAVVWPGAT